MGHYERMITVQAPADRVFEYLRHTENVSQYVPQVRQMHHLDGDRVKVVIDIGGRQLESTGVFRADPQRNRIEWHADERHRYSGLLEVRGGDASPEISDVLVHLSMDESSMRGEKPNPNDTGRRTPFSEAILDEMQKALELIRRVVEERVGAGRLKFAP